MLKKVSCISENVHTASWHSACLGKEHRRNHAKRPSDVAMEEH
jgi:hypothetical protein